MTPLRQAFHAALVAALASVAAPTHAEPIAPIGPPTAADAAAAAPIIPAPAPVAVPAAPAASAKAPSWLATRSAPKAPVAGKSAMPSTGRMLGLLLVVGALGGAALYLKRRNRGEAKGAPAQQRLMVLSSTRIGPKAHAVVISVAGRQMLLGVTDSSVKRLAFIDEVEEEEREREREPVRRTAASAATRGAAIQVRTVTPEAGRAGSFADILKTAFSRKPAPRDAGSDAASILAAETQDTVGGKPTAPSNVRMLDVEGQAQGLLRRLSERS
jgi:flagellar biogenesis protein FliO